MARSKEFNREAALRAAVAVFSERGYSGATTEDLLAAMGISRQSMYDTFGDKRRLYLDALRHYQTENVATLIRTLNATFSPIKGLEAALLAFAAKLAADGTRGSLCLGAIADFGRSDPEVAALIDAAGSAIVAALERVIAHAKEAKEISDEIDARAAAVFVGTMLGGMRLVARAGAPEEVLRDIARHSLRSLT